MDQGMRYTTVGHRDLSILNPVGSSALDAVLAVAADGCDAQAVALDVGCGKGELLIRLSERTGCRGLGIDPNPEFLADAESEAARRAPGRIELRCAVAAAERLPDAAYAVSAVVGATHAFGGLAETLAALRCTTRAGGCVLLGEGYWRREPGAEALAALGATREELGSLPELCARVRAAGLDVALLVEAGVDELVRYEDAHRANLRAHRAAHPGDPFAERLWVRREAWDRGLAVAGPDLLGFALLAARVPG